MNKLVAFTIFVIACDRLTKGTLHREWEENSATFGQTKKKEPPQSKCTAGLRRLSPTAMPKSRHRTLDQIFFSGTKSVKKTLHIGTTEITDGKTSTCQSRLVPRPRANAPTGSRHGSGVHHCMHRLPGSPTL